MPRTPLTDKQRFQAGSVDANTPVISAYVAAELEVALRKCMLVLAGERLSKSDLIEALAAARDVLERDF